MRNLKIFGVKFFFLSCIVLVLSQGLTGCYKLQKDYTRTPDTVDAHIYKTAWQFIKDRGIANNTDTIFRVMYNAIIYSGIDTNEYTVPGRTYILLNNTAAKAVWSN